MVHEWMERGGFFFLWEGEGRIPAVRPEIDRQFICFIFLQLIFVTTVIECHDFFFPWAEICLRLQRYIILFIHMALLLG